MLVETTGIFMLFYNGSFVNSKYFKYGLSSIVILLIGLLFTLLNWSYGREIVVLYCSVIVLFYLVNFILKQKKNRLDYLKLVIVVFILITGSLIFLNFINSKYEIIPSVMIWYTIIDYLVTEGKKGKLLKSNI